MKRPLYLLVTADEFELIAHMGSTWRELSEQSGIDHVTLYNAYHRGSVIKNKYKVEIIF